jgi:hypothetical protein
MNSRMRLSVAVKVFIILLYVSCFLCVGTRGRASGDEMVFLADVQCAQAWLRCVNRIVGR